MKIPYTLGRLLTERQTTESEMQRRWIATHFEIPTGTWTLAPFGWDDHSTTLMWVQDDKVAEIFEYPDMVDQIEEEALDHDAGITINTMNIESTSDFHGRKEALDQAIEWSSRRTMPTVEDTVGAAVKFYAFLTDDTTVPTEATPR